MTSYKIINKKKLLAVLFIDVFGYLFIKSFTFLRKRKTIKSDNIEKILLVRTAYIGDVVMTIPVLKPLKELFPKAKVYFLTGNSGAEIIDNNPYIDGVYRYNAFWFYHNSLLRSVGEYIKTIRNVRAEAFDLAIDFRGDIRDIFLILSASKAQHKVSYGVGGGSYLLTQVIPYNELKHKVEYHLDIVRHIGGNTDSPKLDIYLNENEKKAVFKLLNDNQIYKPFFCAHPGARLPLKRWPIERCARLYDKIIEEFARPLILLGSKEDEKLVNEIIRRMKQQPVVFAGKLSIRMLSGILAESSLFICNDSAPMHIAAAMKTPTVAIFGPSKSIETSPYCNTCRVVEKDFPCRNTCDESTCKYKPHHSCMKSIQIEDVFNVTEGILRDTI